MQSLNDHNRRYDSGYDYDWGYNYGRRNCCSFRSCLSLRPIHVLRYIFTIFATLALVFRCLPGPIRGRLRFLFRYISKARPKMSTSPWPKPYRLHSRYQQTNMKDNESDIGLAKVLCYDTLVLLAHKIHYIDLVNLSMVSKRVHQAIYPSEGCGERRLRLYTCEGNQKSPCWACGIQTCQVT